MNTAIKFSGCEFVHHDDEMRLQFRERAFLEAIKYNRQSPQPVSVQSIIDVTYVKNYSELGHQHILNNVYNMRCPSCCGGSLIRSTKGNEFFICTTHGCATKMWGPYIDAMIRDAVEADRHGLVRKVDAAYGESQQKRRRR